MKKYIFVIFAALCLAACNHPNTQTGEDPVPNLLVNNATLTRTGSAKYYLGSLAELSANVNRGSVSGNDNFSWQEGTVYVTTEIKTGKIACRSVAVRLATVSPMSGTVQISNDGITWETIASLPLVGNYSNPQNRTFSIQKETRFIRVGGKASSSGIIELYLITVDAENFETFGGAVMSSRGVEKYYKEKFADSKVKVWDGTKAINIALVDPNDVLATHRMILTEDGVKAFAGQI